MAQLIEARWQCTFSFVTFENRQLSRRSDLPNSGKGKLELHPNKIDEHQVVDIQGQYILVTSTGICKLG